METISAVHKQANEGKNLPQNGQKSQVVKIENLKKAFNGNEVLKGVNLYVNPEENVVVVGKSGSGKSVLIKCMVRLIEPDAGKIWVLDNEITTLKEEAMNQLRLRIGFLFQSGALYDSMTIRENLLFPMQNQDKPLSGKDLENAVKEALEGVGLAKAIDKMPSELSGGMKKRVALARALMLKPEIMLYDEPTTGLDPITAREISKLIVEMQEKYKIASMIITHDMECAHITANRMVMLQDGVFAAEGSYEELEKNDEAWISSFFREPK